MEYLGVWGTLIHEKNLKSKISCQTPFNLLQTRRLFFSHRFYYICAESDDDVSPSQPRGDEAELQGIRHPQVPQSQGKTSVKPLGDLHNLPFIVDIRIHFFWST